MLTTFRKSFKTMVQAKNDDLPLGLLVDMVVNANTGTFEAFWIKALDGTKLLLPKDILFWDSQQITINDASDLALPDSLPRLSNIFAEECPILKADVFDQSINTNIGVVRDFTFDTLSPRLLAIEAQSGWLGLRRQRIPQHRIIKIEPNRIVVDSTLLKTDTPEIKATKKIAVPKLDRSSRKGQ